MPDNAADCIHIVIDVTDDLNQRFIEIEDAAGHSIAIGERFEKDGLLHIKISAADIIEANK